MSNGADHNKFVQLYDGYGHTHDMLVYGHLFNHKPRTEKKYSTNAFTNMIRLVKLFFIKPVPYENVELHWQQQVLTNKTESDGFIKFEWTSAQSVPAGWHHVEVKHYQNGQVFSNEGKLFVPHITQYGFISDIDDTIMVSHSATVFKRLKELFTGNPHTRRIFDDVAMHYQLLSHAHTTPDAPNPFFYVSSSEWNLYNYLKEVFHHNKLPEGAFLLNQVKRWYELLKSGKTKHEGKLIRVMRILDTFPKQQFILIGDNTQADPVIYNKIATKYPQRVHAIYIRNVHPAHAESAKTILSSLEQRTGIATCLFSDSAEAIEHSRSIGLI